MDQTNQHVAIREAFVNLLIHADYREQAVSLIVRSNDGYQFRNPGDSRIPDLDPVFGDRSDPRNPTIVRMFRLIGLAEEAGSGIPRIFQAWRRLGYGLPTFDLGTSGYEFSVRLSFLHLLSDEDREWLMSLGESLTEDEQLALVLARHEGYVDNALLRQVTGQHFVDVSRVLGALRDRRFLRMLGAKRGARYELRDAIDDGPDLNGGLVFSTVDLGSSTVDSVPSTVDLHLMLTQLAAPVSQSGRLSASRRDEVIIGMCALRPLSLTDLASYLKREPAYVRQVLRQLIDQGMLQYEYPDRPQHPGQRYLSRAPIHTDPGGSR